MVGVNEHEYEGQDVLSNASCTVSLCGPFPPPAKDHNGRDGVRVARAGWQLTKDPL